MTDPSPLAELDTLLSNNMGRGCVLDTNLLGLHFVGTLDPLLLKDSRVNNLPGEFFLILQRCLAILQGIFVTPNLLTELHQYLRKIKRSSTRSEEMAALRKAHFAHLVTTAVQEQYFSSSSLVNEPEFQKVGLADASVISLAQEKRLLVLTTDSTLTQKLEQRGLDCVNFFHLLTPDESDSILAEL